MQNYPHEQCLSNVRYGELTYVGVRDVCGYAFWNSRWIWTNFAQLLNWNTLKCMTETYDLGNTHFVLLKECEKDNDLQHWECVGNNKYNIIQKKSGRYMNYGDHYHFVTMNNTQNVEWIRYGKPSASAVCAEGNQIKI